MQAESNDKRNDEDSDSLLNKYQAQILNPKPGFINFKIIQCLLICFLGNFSTGQILGFSGILLPQLEEENAQLSKLEASTIASSTMFAQMFGSVFGGMLANHIGRHRALAVVSFIVCCGWVTIAASNDNVNLLIVGRVLNGFGIMTSIVQVYLSEIAPPDLRGLFGTSGPFGVCIGIALVYIEGKFLPSWRFIVYINIVLSLTCCIGCLAILLETPIWLWHHNKQQLAIKTAEQLRIASPNQSPNYEDKVLQNVKTFPILKPLALILSLCFLVQMSGQNTIMAYAVSACRDIGFTEDPDSPAIVISSMRLIGTIFSFFYLKRTKRRTAFISTAIVMAVSLFTLALVVTLISNSLLKAILGLILICIFLIAVGTGAGSIIFILSGELVPVKLRSLTSGCAVCMAYLSSFLSVFTYKYLLEWIGQAMTYGVYGIFALMSASVAFKFLPETKGLTEDQMENLF